MNQSVTTYFRHPQIRDCHRFVILQDYLTHEKHYLEAVWSSSSTITNQPGPYFARVRFGGKLYRHALGTSDYKLARRKLADFRNGLERTDATKGKTSLAKMLDARDEVNAYRNDCRRYIVESDEVLSAFLELEATLL